MTNVFISVPMNGRTIEDVMADITQAFMDIPKLLPGEELNISHNAYCSAPCGSGRLYYLGSAIRTMDAADVVYFCKGWENSKGCQVEHYVCELYGIQRIEAT